MHVGIDRGTAALVALAAALALAPAARGASTHDRADGSIDDDAEVRALLRSGTTTPLAGLDAAERAYVIERGLIPVGEPESGGGAGPVTHDDLRPSSAAGAARASTAAPAAGSRSGTWWCQRRNAVGIVLWRYNSRWTWSWGAAGNVRTADHSEFPGSLAPGWKYRGSVYRWGIGALMTPGIGRAVQGTFDFGFPYTIIQKNPILEVIVRGGGGYSVRCVPS